jgi:hypothetical protein
MYTNAEGLFTFRWEGDMLKAVNEAVGGDYTTGCLPKGGDAVQRKGTGACLDFSGPVTAEFQRYPSPPPQASSRARPTITRMGARLSAQG